MTRILGLDLGTTSVGFALVDYDESKSTGQIVRMGVRIFPEGVTPPGGGKGLEPRNKQRRNKRLTRRLLRRRKLRRRLLNQLLTAKGLLPPFGTKEWNDLMCQQSAQKGKEEEGKRETPYQIRARGLEKELKPYELGRAIYHLAHRRGFLGRRIEDAQESKSIKNPDEDTESIKGEIESLRRSLGQRTLGSYLAEQPKKRGRHIGRDMIENELDRLLATQAPYHKQALTPETCTRIRDLILRQRPTYWRLATLGKCRLVPEAPLAPKGSWAAQQYVMLEHINKLRLSGGNARPIDAEERAFILDLARAQGSVTFGEIRKALRPLWRKRGFPEKQSFNLEVGENLKSLPGNRVEAKLSEIFGDEWHRHPSRDRIRAEIHQRLWTADYRQIGNKRVEIVRDDEAARTRAALAKSLEAEWGITQEQAEKIAELDLPSGWLRLSSVAIERMLPEMETGVGAGDLLMSPQWENWRNESFPTRERPTGEIRDFLSSHPRHMPELRNPTVHRVLNELRKVVNNLIRVYGKPDLIRIELARELNKTRDQRLKLLSDNRTREKERKDAAKDLSERGIENPDRRTIEKWLLWKEANEYCPYTGRKISFDALFRTGEFDVEHIWPRSRCLDNSFANKTLCEKEFNISIKGNKTPFEIYAGNAEALDQLRQRLATCKLPEYKIRRFLKPDFAEVGTDEFSDRQLADTGWASKAARDFLKKLFPDDGRVPPVETVNGQLTAYLRRNWGLETILSPEGGGKNRADHRHHAVDALAAALTTRSAIQQLSTYYGSREKGKRPKFGLPWNNFWHDAQTATNAIIVSHKRQRKVSGGLHAETFYGDTRIDETRKGKIYRNFVTRKALQQLTPGEIERIRDPVIRQIVADHVASHGGKPAKAFPPYPKLANKNGNEVEIRRVRVTTPQQLELMIRLKGGYVDPANNHHMVIFQNSDGEIDFEVVSLFEASIRVSQKQSVVRRKRKDNARFIMSIAPGDMLTFPRDDNGHDYRVVSGVWSNGPIVLVDHWRADGEVWKRPGAKSVIEARATKVSISPIGEISPCND